MTIRIATYNIRKGGRKRQGFLADVVRALDADLTVLQEATDSAVVRSVAEAAGAEAVIHARGRSVAVISRLPVGRVTWHRMAPTRSFVEVELAGIGVRVLGVHLSAGLSARGERRRLREIRRVLDVARAAPGPARTLIVGDLNAVAPGDLASVVHLPAWIRLLLRVDGGIGTVVVASLLADGYTDGFRHLNPGLVGPTMPVAAPSVRLDYLMVGPDLVPALVACGLGSVPYPKLLAASDHLPVVLDMEPQRGQSDGDVPAAFRRGDFGDVHPGAGR